MSLRLRTFPRIFQTTVRLQRGSRTRGASGLQYKMLWRVESTAYQVSSIKPNLASPTPEFCVEHVILIRYFTFVLVSAPERAIQEEAF